MSGRPLFVTLADDSWQRAHYAFVVMAGALSLGREVTLFAGGRGVLALAENWSGLAGFVPDEALAARSVPGFGELRAAVAELGAEMMACETGLALAGLDRARLMPGVTVRGIVTFLEKTGDNPVLAL